MRNNITLLVLSLFFIQCSKDDNVKEEEMTNEETFLFGINVLGDYYTNERSSHLYLSDSDGTIIADGPLLNNQETTLSAVFDLNNTYDATLVEKNTFNGETIYLTKTYVDVRPATYIISRPENPNPDEDRILINLTNTGGGVPITVLRHSGSGYTTQGNTANGGTFEFDGRMAASPGDYFVSFLSENEGIPRYFWQENVSPNSVFTSDYNDLLFLDKIVKTQFPPNQSLSASILGYRSSDVLKTSHLLFFENYQDGTNSITSYLPQYVVFDFYNFNASFNINNTSYFVSKNTESIDAQIEIPNLTLNIQSSDISNFRMTTSTNVDSYKASFVYNQNNSNTYLLYDVIGKPTPTTMFSKANLFDTIFSDEPALTSETILFSSASIGRSNYINGYSEYIADQLTNKRYYAIDFLSESVSKSE